MSTDTGSTTTETYLRAADTLLASCRLAALAALPAEARARADELLPGAAHRPDEPLAGRSDVAYLMRRGVTIAAHLVYVRLHQVGGSDQDEGGVAGAVQHALPALHVGDLSTRLQAARLLVDIAPDAGRCETALRDLATLLSRPAGSPEARDAAAGHLCRTVLATFGELYQPFADLAYWSAFGDRLLVPTAITRAAALALVVTGAEKKRVAGRAGISRQTLDNWIRTESTRP